MKHTKIIGYARVSTSKQNYGLEAQKQAIEVYAHENGLELISIFVERESGKNDTRVELAKAIAESKLNKASLVVAKLDRLSRNVSFIFTLRDSGVDFVALDLRDFNTMTLGIFASVAQHERELISSRIKDSLKIAKQQGKKIGRKKNCIVSELAMKNSLKTRKAISMEKNLDTSKQVEIYLHDKITLSEIARRLNKVGHRTVRGKPHTARSVKNLIVQFNLSSSSIKGG